MDSVFYSLLVPCYNAGAYIDSFLANIAGLARSFDEVIFYDDASTDNTVQMLSSKGYRVIEGEVNHGPGYARNQLAKAASGTYIHFHDIDDEFAPGFLVCIDDNLKVTHADVILGGADWIDAETRSPIIQWRYNAEELQKDAVAYFVMHPLGIINTIYKRSVFLNAGGFNEQIKCWEDADLHVKLAASGCSFAVIDSVLAYSLRHSNGISQNQLWCWECRLKFIESYLQNYPALKNTLAAEVKKVQNVYVSAGLYNKLGEVIRLNKKFDLSFHLTKVSVLYYLNKILPSVFIGKLIGLARNGRS